MKSSIHSTVNITAAKINTFPYFWAYEPVRREWNIMMVSSKSHRNTRWGKKQKGNKLILVVVGCSPPPKCLKSTPSHSGYCKKNKHLSDLRQFQITTTFDRRRHLFLVYFPTKLYCTLLEDNESFGGLDYELQKWRWTSKEIETNLYYLSSNLYTAMWPL